WESSRPHPWVEARPLLAAHLLIMMLLTRRRGRRQARSHGGGVARVARRSRRSGSWRAGARSRSGGHALVVEGVELLADLAGRGLQFLEETLLAGVDLAIGEDPAPQHPGVAGADGAVGEDAILHGVEHQDVERRLDALGAVAQVEQELQLDVVDAPV